MQYFRDPAYLVADERSNVKEPTAQKRAAHLAWKAYVLTCKLLMRFAFLIACRPIHQYVYGPPPGLHVNLVESQGESRAFNSCHGGKEELYNDGHVIQQAIVLAAPSRLPAKLMSCIA